MDNSNYPRNRHSEQLGVNKIGKNIRKNPNPMPQPNYANPDVNPARPVSQPQVYNINKNDFRNIVQQLTGSPSHHSQEPIPIPVPRPPHISPKSPSLRLQRIRPPPLSPISVNRPRLPVHIPPARPPHDPLAPGQLPQRTALQPPLAGWGNTAESPVSAYVRYLQRSINDPGNAQTQSAGLLPVPSPRSNGLTGLQPLLPSPSSQFLLQSPSGYLNLSSPRSPYPLLPPGYQHPPPLTPNFPFSPMGRVGILGPGPQGPPSPGISFPLSPGFFPLSSPKWRD